MAISALVSAILIGVSILIVIPTAVLFVELMAGAFFPRKPPERAECPDSKRIAVLIPAHDEGEGLLPTLNDVRAQLREGDRLLVVADNCSDNTASVAASAGAEVIVRSDSARRGKAYALEFGLEHLAADPPDVVVMIDADCRVASGSLAALADTCVRFGRPAQALDLMTCAPGSPARRRVAELAWRVKNWARPLGLHSFGLPCQLMGTGMAFPWEGISKVAINHDLVEDLRLGLDLAALGSAPLFCPAAIVTSEFPSTDAASASQRQRWEHGHIAAILTVAPAMLWRAARRGNVQLLALAIDMLVPPLTLLVAAAGAIWALTLLAALVGLSPWPLMISTIGVGLLFTAVLLAWLDYGRDILPVGSLGTAGLYALAKFTLYREFFAGRASREWTRTERGSLGPDHERSSAP